MTRTGNERRLSGRRVLAGEEGLPGDIPVPCLNRKLGSRVISCFAKWWSCSGGQLKRTKPFDITSHLQLRPEPGWQTPRDSDSRHHALLGAGLNVVGFVTASEITLYLRYSAVWKLQLWDSDAPKKDDDSCVLNLRWLLTILSYKDKRSELTRELNWKKMTLIFGVQLNDM